MSTEQIKLFNSSHFDNCFEIETDKAYYFVQWFNEPCWSSRKITSKGWHIIRHRFTTWGMDNPTKLNLNTKKAEMLINAIHNYMITFS